MDNLFSFPAAALSASAPTTSDASDTPASEPSTHAIPSSETPQTAEESENVREVSATSAAASAVADDAQLHVRLKMLNERVFDVHVDRAVEVAQFRAAVERATAVPAALQRLIYRGKLLKDGARLASYDIQDGHTIHLVAKPAGGGRASSPPPSLVTPAFTSTSAPSATDDERERLNRFIGRSRERLRQTMDEEQRATSERNEFTGSQRLAPPPTTTATSRVRRPGAGDPTGDAWNLAVLREALGQHSDRIPARPSNRDAASMDMLRQGSEQRQMAENDAPADTAAAMGLDPTTAAEQQPNLDYLSQGILTLRTVLSTAAVPHDGADTAQEPAETEAASESSGESDGESTEAQEQEITTPVVSPRASSRRGRRRFFVGQWLDVKDTVNQWLECTVMDMTEDKVLVHYHGWPSRWDEWLDFDSDRIAAFRTRTQHTQNASHLSPAPSTRLPNAPSVGENDMRRIVPQIRDLMEAVLPYVDQLATLCESEDQDAGDEYSEDRVRRREELSEMAHLVAPFFDRFGRLLVDSARQLDPLLHPDLRHEERRRRLQRVRGSASSRPATRESSTPVEDSALGVRDLITTAVRPPQEAQGARRSIDVHIHAIVAPSSLSSLASLARLGTAIAGAMGSSSRSNSTALAEQRRSSTDLEDAFGLPRIRPVQGGSGERSILTDIDEPDDEDARYTDTSRTPLLSSFRRNSSRSNGAGNNYRGDDREPVTPRPRRLVRSSSSRLHDFLSDDFFGPSFSQDSDDMDDPVTHDGFGATDRGNEDVVQYQEIPSPRESDSEAHRTSEHDAPRIGVIPEVAEAEQRMREQRERHEMSSSDEAGRSSSSSSASSSGYPTFLEVMRRTLNGVRNFGFSSSSTSSQNGDPPMTPSATPTDNHRSTQSDSDSSSSDSSSSTSEYATHDADNLAEARAVLQASDPVLAFSRLRQPSSVSSIEEDLDSVD